MEVNKEKIRFFLQFFFDKGENASQVAEIAKGVYGVVTVAANCVQFWFRRFRSCIFDVKNAPRPGRPVIKNVDKITEIIEVDRHVSSRSITQELKIDHKTVLSHLREESLLGVASAWPNTKFRFLVSTTGPFETSDWPELANRRGVVFHQDNARSHTSVVTRQNLWELGWEVLMHPPYSPDLAPSDYPLFLALQNFLSEIRNWDQDCENRLLDVFVNKGEDFYERGIMKLPLKWQQIIQQNGAYLIQIGHSEAC
ncbi:histone-lysine N-methyltransferase SETMAR [Trichonephila clavipes]|nr:histone-lysine N-methyltransferase SETMAR [Trichonephila clavipes]